MDPSVQYKIYAGAGSTALAVMGCWAGRKLTIAGSAEDAGLDAVLQFGNTLSAGILLAASLVHMLPDAFEALRPFSDFPLASVFAGVAFIALIFLSEIVESMIFTFDEEDPEAALETYQAMLPIAPRKTLMNLQSVEMPQAARSFTRGLTNSLEAGGSPSATPGRAKARAGFARQQTMKGGAMLRQRTSTTLSEPFLPSDKKACTNSKAEFTEGGLAGEKGKTTAIGQVKSFLLFIALSFHSVMEGLGMGSAQDSGLVLGVMLAILAHKGLAAFALGCTLTQAEVPGWKFWAFTITFSAGTALGCFIGYLSASAGADADKSFFSGLCVALSSGTFLQISSMELLPTAMAKEDHRLKGLAGLTLGFAFMSALAIWC